MENQTEARAVVGLRQLGGEETPGEEHGLVVGLAWRISIRDIREHTAWL